jgi:hypothetical protein
MFKLALSCNQLGLSGRRARTAFYFNSIILDTRKIKAAIISDMYVFIFGSGDAKLRKNRLTVLYVLDFRLHCVGRMNGEVQYLFILATLILNSKKASRENRPTLNCCSLVSRF